MDADGVQTLNGVRRPLERGAQEDDDAHVFAQLCNVRVQFYPDALALDDRRNTLQNEVDAVVMCIIFFDENMDHIRALPTPYPILPRLQKNFNPLHRKIRRTTAADLSGKWISG